MPDSELMPGSRVAIISDIHGNSWALEAVLSDIDRRGVLYSVNLGDSLYGPLDPAGTADMLIGLGLPTVRGNEDRIVTDEPTAADSPTLRFVRESLRREHLDWLERLEATNLAFSSLFMCHGTPESDCEYLLHEVRDMGVVFSPASVVARSLSGIPQPVVLCGHDHLPRTVRLSDGQLVVNPGSVGLPAYAGDIPLPHVMETGTPHARYTVLSRGKCGWVIEDIAVPYDWEAAAHMALENKRPDWAAWLETGRGSRS